MTAVHHQSSWNETARPYPRGQSVHAIVRAIAEERPDAVAVLQGRESVSYRRLDSAADAYAVSLAALGVRRGDLVPIRLPRGAELVAAVLAVLKLGAAYALLDASWPRTRVDDVLEQLEAGVLVDTVDGAPVGTSVRRWSPPPGGLAAVEGTAPGFRPVAASGEDPCCVFFTSGTTGRPKGVLTPHRATVRLFRPDGSAFARFAADTVMPQAAPVPWDGYTLELWSVLLNGGTSLLVDEPYITSQTLRTGVARHGLDTAWLTSSLFNMLVDEDLCAFEGMRQVMIGGERLSAPHVRRFLAEHPGILLLNGYGPVESTVFATTHRITAEDCEHPDGIPIGRPVADTQVYVLDGTRLCEVGETGELCVAGDGLAIRYLGQPGLTAEKFTRVEIDGRSVRVYRTGDVGHWDEQGLLRYHGRADRQVKIRGHRIEPEEVERQIESLLSAVRRCVVVARRDEEGICQSLAALCVPHLPGDPLTGALDLVRAALVRYQVPDVLLSVDRLPLTVNGKLDENALLALLPVPAEEETPIVPGAPGAPGGATTADLVAGVFAEVLGRSTVPVDADFFTALGGTSLAAGRVCARLSAKLDWPVPITALYRHTTAETLGDHLADDGTPEQDEPAVSSTPAEIPLSSVQEGFLIRHLLDSEDLSGHCLGAWEITGDLDERALACAVADVHVRHQALGSSYQADRTRTYSVPGASLTPGITALAEAVSVDQALARVRAALAGPFDLRGGRIWRTVLVRTRGGAAVLGYAVHHVAFDGWSESVLANDLAYAYNARLSGRAPDWPALPDAARVRSIIEAHERSADLHRQRAYLGTALQGIPELRWPGAVGTSCGTGSPTAGGVSRIELLLAAQETAALDGAAAALGLTRFPLLLTAYARALSALTGQDDFGIGVPVARRVDARMEGLVGCHVAMACLRLPASALGTGAPGTGSHGAAEAGRLIREAFSCQDVGFAETVRLVNPPRSVRAPLFQTIFAYQDNAPARLPLSGADARFHRLPYLGIPAEIQAEAWPEDGGLRIVLNTRTAAVPADFARGLAKTFADQVRTVATH